MSGPTPPTDMQGWMREVDKRLSRLDRRSSGNKEPRGTTAERNQAFWVPANDAERAALANEKVVWFNTDLGWWESYYATTGTAGLTAKGLVAGTAPGWYPVGLGPYIRLEPGTTFAATPNNPIRSWAGLRNDRNGGSAWFTYTDADGRITVPRAGRYLVRAQTVQQTGTGTSNFHLRQLNANAYERHVDGVATPLNSTLFTLAHAEAEFPAPAGRQFDLYVQSGTLNVHSGGSTGIRGEFLVRYMGPLLVSD